MNILDSLAKRGAENLFSNYNYYNNHIDLEFVKRQVFESGYLDEHLDSMDLYEKHTQDMFCNFLRLASEVRVSNSSFVAKAVDTYTSESFIDEHRRDIACGSMLCVIQAAKRKLEFDWFSMFEQLYASSYGRANSYIRSPILTVLENSTKQDPNKVKDLAEKELFKTTPRPHHAWRGVWYAEFIKTGSLTKKYARKIRSESSSAASYAGVKALVESKELYSNYDELLLLMSDSKHEDVLRLLARELPIHLLTSIMGAQSRVVLSDIQRRMEAHERDKAKREAEAKAAKTIGLAPDLLGSLF